MSQSNYHRDDRGTCASCGCALTFASVHTCPAPRQWTPAVEALSASEQRERVRARLCAEFASALPDERRITVARAMLDADAFGVSP